MRQILYFFRWFDVCILKMNAHLNHMSRLRLIERFNTQ